MLTSSNGVKYSNLENEYLRKNSSTLRVLLFLTVFEYEYFFEYLVIKSQFCN